MPSPVCKRSRSCAAVLAVVTALQAASACASTPVQRLPVVTAPQGAAKRLGDVTLPPGTACLVTLVSGKAVHGLVVSLTADQLVIDRIEGVSPHRTAIPEADIARIARVTGRSKPFRGRLGAAIGAVASLPLSMSLVGDAILLGAVVGNVIGRRTGDSRLEVVLRR